MDAVTYPMPEVVELLNKRFVCYSVSTEDPRPEGRGLLRTYRLLWEPGFVFLDHGGVEMRRFVGFRAPADFVAELRVVLGKVDFLRRRYTEAVRGFRGAAESAVSRDLVAEALYWAGIAVYRRSGRDLEELKEAWKELRERFPDSSWSQSADVFDCRPTGRRPGGET